MEKNYKVLKSPTLSTSYDSRYVVVDINTGEVLDDAQGYGYKTAQKAYSAYAYKTRDKKKDGEIRKKKQLVKEWCKTHKDIVGILEADAFCIAKGSYGPDDKFDAKWVRKVLKEEGLLDDLPFTIRELMKYWYS